MITDLEIWALVVPPVRAYITVMSTFVTVLLVAAMFGTLGVVLVGVFSMARGGEFNRRYSNKLMRARVALQFIALVLFALIMLVVGKP